MFFYYPLLPVSLSHELSKTMVCLKHFVNQPNYLEQLPVFVPPSPTRRTTRLILSHPVTVQLKVFAFAVITWTDNDLIWCNPLRSREAVGVEAISRLIAGAWPGLPMPRELMVQCSSPLHHIPPKLTAGTSRHLDGLNSLALYLNGPDRTFTAALQWVRLYSHIEVVQHSICCEGLLCEVGKLGNYILFLLSPLFFHIFFLVD